MAQYATNQDLRDQGLPPEALRGVDGREVTKFLRRAGDLMDTYLTQQYTLPITGALADPTTGENTFPGALIRCNVIIAAADLLQWRGYNPDDFDALFDQRLQRCIEWLEALASGKVSLGEVDATPNVSESAPIVNTNGASRVWAAPDGKIRGW